MNPHPMKVQKGGEDAFSVSKCSTLLSVADGVGGWINSGVDPALYSKQLCRNINSLHLEHSEEPKNYDVLTRDILVEAARNNNEIGSCTVCLADIEKEQNIVNTANLGDAGYLWLRK